MGTMVIRDSDSTLEFHIPSLFIVRQLSSAVRQKWEQAASSGDAACTCSLERILQRQQAAEEKRLVSTPRAPFRVRPRLYNARDVFNVLIRLIDLLWASWKDTKPSGCDSDKTGTFHAHLLTGPEQQHTRFYKNSYTKL